MDGFSVKGCIKTSNLFLLVIPITIAVILLIASPQWIRRGESTKIHLGKFLSSILIPSALIVAVLWYFEYVDFSGKDSEICSLSK